jgi:hypothetical protein
MINLFPVRHVSQRGMPAGACGVACLMMLTPAYKPETAYSAMKLQPGQWAHIVEHLRRGLRYYGMQSEYERLAAFEIRDYVGQGKPVVCLINYGALPPELRRADYDGAHYVLAVGYDRDCIMVHDPLGSDETGAYIPYPDSVLHRSMRDVPGNTYDYQCLVVDVRWLEVEPVDEEGLPPSLQLKVLFKRLGVAGLGDALVKVGELEARAKGRRVG